MSCDAFYPLLVSESLTEAEASRVAFHLTSCDACREAASLLAEAEDAVADELAPGTLIENFRVVRALGRGGSSVVYLAKHVAISKRVAIKVLAEPTDVRARFLRDATIVSQLSGETIRQLHGFGELPSGQPYMILEYLDGEDLQERLEREQQIAIPVVVDAILDTCCALAEAHPRGIVHRDIKPANLFATVLADGSSLVKVLDFGAAKISDGQLLTRTGAALGSVPFMAPEQLRSSRSIDHRADLWSLGVTLQYLVTGELPFSGSTQTDIAIRIWTEPPAHSDVIPPALASVLDRCLAKSASARYEDVAELANALAPFGSRTAADRARRARRILDETRARTRS